MERSAHYDTTLAALMVAAIAFCFGPRCFSVARCDWWSSVDYHLRNSSRLLVHRAIICTWKSSQERCWIALSFFRDATHKFPIAGGSVAPNQVWRLTVDDDSLNDWRCRFSGYASSAVVACLVRHAWSAKTT